MSNDEIVHLRIMFALQRRTQQALEKQRAQFSAGYAPVHILNGIHDITRQIIELEQRLKDLGIDPATVSTEDIPISQDLYEHKYHADTIVVSSQIYNEYKIKIVKKIDSKFNSYDNEFIINFMSDSTTYPMELCNIEELLSFIEENKQVILRAPAGSGKTSIVKKIAKISLTRKIIPIIIKLSDWKNQVSDQLKDHKTVEDKINYIFLNGITPINIQIINQFPKNLKRIIIIDGLNEVKSQEIAFIILESISTYINDLDTFMNTYALITDRMSPVRLIPDNWISIRVNPLSKEEVFRNLQGKYSVNYSEREGTLLENPYFLDFAINNPEIPLESSIVAIHTMLSQKVNLNPEDINILSNFAYETYEINNSLSMDINQIKDKVGDIIYDKLALAGLLRESDQNVNFNHQILHDYLVAKYLIWEKREFWNDFTFDICTFRSNSIDVLILALEELNNPKQGDVFIEAIYNWNWLASAMCISSLINTNNRYFTKEIEYIILSISAEKLFDPVVSSRKKVSKLISTINHNNDINFFNIKSIDDIFYLINEYYSENKKFITWRSIFTRSRNLPIDEDCIRLINSPNSLLGWTIANVIRRYTLSSQNYIQLRQIYYSTREFSQLFDADNNKEQNSVSYLRTVRWRVIHTLGIPGNASDTMRNIETLFDAMDNDPYFWVRYGASRSLVEIAALTHYRELRLYVIQNIIKRISKSSMEEKIIEEIGRAVFYYGACREWPNDAKTLLEEAKNSYNTDTEKAKWNSNIDAFMEFVAGGML